MRFLGLKMIIFGHFSRFLAFFKISFSSLQHLNYITHTNWTDGKNMTIYLCLLWYKIRRVDQWFVIWNRMGHLFWLKRRSGEVVGAVAEWNHFWFWTDLGWLVHTRLHRRKRLFIWIKVFFWKAIVVWNDVWKWKIWLGLCRGAKYITHARWKFERCKRVRTKW